MNLNSNIQEEDGWFVTVIWVTCVACVALVLTGVLVFKKMGLILNN